MKPEGMMREDYESLPRLRRLHYLWLLWTWVALVWIGTLLKRPGWFDSGRRFDRSPTVCQRCGWVGRVRDCAHGYQDDGAGDVEGCSECPECGDQSV